MSAIFALWTRDYSDLDPNLAPAMSAALEHHALDASDLFSQNDLTLGAHLRWDTPEDVNSNQPLHLAHITLLLDGRIDNRESIAASISIPGSRSGGVRTLHS